MKRPSRNKITEKHCCCKYGGGSGCDRCGGTKAYCSVAERAKQATLRRVASALIVHSHMRADG